MVQRLRPTVRGRRTSAALAVLGIVWLASALTLRIVHAGRVLPGTSVAGAALGGADAAESRRRLRFIAAPDRTVVVTDGRRRFKITSRQVGLRIDAWRTATRALETGRAGLLDFLATPAAAFGYSRRSEPLYSLDAAVLRRATAAIARRVDIAAFEGGLTIEPSTLATEIEPPRDGRRLDQPALVDAAASALRNGSPNRLGLPMHGRPAASRQAVERVAAQAEAYLEDGPVRLKGAGPPLALSPADVAPLLEVEPAPGGKVAGVELGVDQSRARDLIARLAERRDRRPRDARLNAAAAPVLLDGKGEVSWRPRSARVVVHRARPGRAIDQERAAAALAAAIREGRHDVDLPVRRVRPAISTQAAGRANNLIGTFTTHFPCCQPRVRNIRLIARGVDRTVVAPGDEFSLNRVAGPRTRAGGFVPAPFISNGELVQSVGGGVSQFSTTMYNAAFFAGLQLDAHQPHSFYIDRYPAGREATLDYGSIDLAWTNDTPSPILVRASTTATSVTVSLYGANGGRRVRAAAGARRPVGGRDFAITVTRTIRYPDGRVVRQPHTTTYDRPPAD